MKIITMKWCNIANSNDSLILLMNKIDIIIYNHVVRVKIA
jgi:hypothetical protein